MTHKSSIEITEEQARDVLEKIGEEFVSLEEVKHGIVNKIYFLKGNKKYVLRIITPPWEYKVLKEKRIYELIDVPKPKILLADTSKEIIPYVYMLWEKIEGENLDEIFSTLTKETQIEIAKKMGEYLAKIHSVEFNKFGDINEEGISLVKDITISCPSCDPGPFKTWKEMYKQIVEMDLNGLKKTKFSAFEDKFRKFFEENIDKIPPDIKPSLCHMDFEPENIVVKNGEIVAIMDYEWAIIGDSEYDYYKTISDKGMPELVEAFKEEYTKIRPLSKEYEKKAKLYKISRLINQMIGFEWITWEWEKEKKEAWLKELWNEGNCKIS